MTWEKGRELCLWMYVWHTGNPEFWVWLWLLTNPWPRTSCLSSWISQMYALLLLIGLAMDFNKQTLSLITHADALCYPVVKKNTLQRQIWGHLKFFPMNAFYWTIQKSRNKVTVQNSVYHFQWLWVIFHEQGTSGWQNQFSYLKR